MENYKIIPFPIDNKHILEDFADAIHNGDCIESRYKGCVRQAFYDGSFLWELIYRLGDNHFSVIRRNYDGLHDSSTINIRSRIEILNWDDEVRVKVTETSYGFECEYIKYIEL
jgi:hypothetical protein